MPWGAIIGGAAQIAGSLIGGRARRREQKAAQAQQAADLDQVRNFEFSNTFKGLENTAEDLTVNQQASNFQAQQTDQALAGGLDAIVASGGGGGGAQAIANAALASKQGISNDLAAQESANQAIRQQEASNLQAAEATGEQDLQSQQFEQQKGNLNLSSARLDTANAARKAATDQLVGGISSIAGAGKDTLGKLGGIAGKAGGFLSKAAGFLSDRRFKKNIEKVGVSASGINIYQWEYLGEEQRYEGVMADEVPHEEVGGIKYVDYTNLDVEFKEV